MILDDIKSPLSLTQTKGLLGEDEDDLLGPGLGNLDRPGGFGPIDHNFKSQTLQF